jgi:hypothetical protein
MKAVAQRSARVVCCAAVPSPVRVCAEAGAEKPYYTQSFADLPHTETDLRYLQFEDVVGDGGE